MVRREVEKDVSVEAYLHRKGLIGVRVKSVGTALEEKGRH